MYCISALRMRCTDDQGMLVSAEMTTNSIGSNFSNIASGTIATPTTDYIATSILHYIFIIILALY